MAAIDRTDYARGCWDELDTCACCGWAGELRWVHRFSNTLDQLVVSYISPLYAEDCERLCTDCIRHDEACWQKRERLSRLDSNGGCSRCGAFERINCNCTQ